MVTAESLNFDVLDLIFSYLSGQDLASTALVSKTFLASVLPTLYRNVWFRLRESKAYNSGLVMSPFAVILKYPTLAVHVRSIDIECVPSTTNVNIIRQPHPTFMRECAKAIASCQNMTSFKCTLPNALPSFLLAFQNKPRLQKLRIYSNLTTEQTRLLTNISGLSHLVLEFASWNLIDALPNWVPSFQNCLRSLTFYMTNELNVETLNRVLEQVPNLLGLHIVGCARLDHAAVLKVVRHTPELESLSFTVTENANPVPQTPATLRNLQALCMDTRYTRNNSPVPTTLLSILDYLKSSTCQLTSFAIKMPERSIIIGFPFIERLMGAYGPSLKRLAFIDCTLESPSLKLISKRGTQLERLDVAIPVKELHKFGNTLAPSKSLKTLVHIDNQHIHGVRPPINQESVENLFGAVKSLRTVVSDRRVWVRKELVYNFVQAKIDRRLPPGPRSLWFLPSNRQL